MNFEQAATNVLVISEFTVLSAMPEVVQVLEYNKCLLTEQNLKLS